MVGTGSLVEVVGITTSKGKEYASSIEKMEIVGKEQPALTSTTKLSLSFCFLGDVCCILKKQFRRFRHYAQESLFCWELFI